MNRRAAAILVVLLVIALAGVVIYTLTKQGGATTVDTLMPLPAGFKTAANYGESSVVFSNNRALVSYDYLAGKSAVLSAEDPGNGLANIDSLSASDDGRYVLFHQEQRIEGGNLAAILQQRQLDQSTDYWWLYDTTARTFTPLPAQTLIAKFSGGAITLLRTGESGESLTTYSLPSVNQIASINIPGSTDFWKYDNGFLLQRPNEDIAYTEDGVVTQTFFKATTLIGFVSGSDKGLGMIGTGDAREVVLLDLKAHSSKVLAQNTTQPALVDSKGYGFYVSTRTTVDGIENTYYTYDFAHDKSDIWKLSGDAAKKSTDETPNISVLLGNSGVIGDTDTNSPFAFGSGFAAVNLPPDLYSKSIAVPGASYTMTYDSQNRWLIVDNPASASSAVILVAEAQARNDGLNPDLFPLQYEPPDGD